MSKAKKVISLASARKAKVGSERDQRFARVAAHLELLEINEFNFVAPDDGPLEML